MALTIVTCTICYVNTYRQKRVPTGFEQKGHPQPWKPASIKNFIFANAENVPIFPKRKSGIHRTAEDVMKDMRKFHSVLYMFSGERNPKRCLEEPTKTQAEVLHALGYYVDGSGVLQPLKS